MVKHLQTVVYDGPIPYSSFEPLVDAVLCGIAGAPNLRFRKQSGFSHECGVSNVLGRTPGATHASHRCGVAVLSVLMS